MVEIQIYIRPTCPWCIKARELLQRNKLPFEIRDINESENYRDDVLEKSGQLAVPMIVIDGQVFVGYDEKKLQAAIKSK